MLHFLYRSAFFFLTCVCVCRYKTVATLSTAEIEHVVTTDGRTVGVDMEALQDPTKHVLVPAASAESMATYNKYFRGFQLNPDCVCTAVPAPRAERRVPAEFKLADCRDKRGVIAVIGNDLHRFPRSIPADVCGKVYATALGDVVLMGLPTSEHGTIDDHHSAPIRGDMTKVRAERRRMRLSGVPLQPRLARFHGANQTS
jgi:hypothetical protein